ncbi:MAG: hypothetical protein KDD37_07880, partial [Bdellovibrionales bacterium]|nr:hypothetical protein [Bdellovibrionales bacterium]
FIAFIATVSFAGVSYAEDQVGPLTKVSANSASVSIQTEDAESTQAAYYVNGAEINAMIDMMLSDPTSELSKLKTKILTENCDDLEDLDVCGEFIVSKDRTMTSFGRGGWMDAGATYSVFVGFLASGTGHFLELSHIVMINESAEADLKDDGFTYAGTVTKKIALQRIVEVPSN